MNLYTFIFLWKQQKYIDELKKISKIIVIDVGKKYWTDIEFQINHNKLLFYH